MEQQDRELTNSLIQQAALALCALAFWYLMTGCSPYAVETSTRGKATTTAESRQAEVRGDTGSLSPSPTPFKLCATVTATNALHIRALPNADSVVIGYLYFNQEVEVVFTAGKWWYVKADVAGYSNSKYLLMTTCKTGE